MHEGGCIRYITEPAGIVVEFVAGSPELYGILELAASTPGDIRYSSEAMSRVVLPFRRLYGILPGSPICRKKQSSQVAHFQLLTKPHFSARNPDLQQFVLYGICRSITRPVLRRDSIDECLRQIKTGYIRYTTVVSTTGHVLTSRRSRTDHRTRSSSGIYRISADAACDDRVNFF